MKTYQIPNTDLEVSRLAFGTALDAFFSTKKEIKNMRTFGGFCAHLRTSFVVFAVLLFSFTAFAQFEEPETSPILEKMVGVWEVEQSTWSGPNVEATELPAAMANRRLVDGAFLQEEMTLAPNDSDAPFNRTSYINYNGVNGFYEYFSVDSRAPQQMRYQAPKGTINAQGTIKLDGGLFTAADWGGAKNVTFTYRAEISLVKKGRQTFRLFLTPTRGDTPQEFLAFQYNYTKRR